jgi:hypothetical protein
MVMPWIITDDPDSYNQGSLSIAQRLQLPTVTMKQFNKPFRIVRHNKTLYQQGKLSPGDTSLTNPMYQ